MGRVRTKTVKKAARVIIEKYYTKLTLDFHTNKRIIEEVALIPSKPLRNKIAGFITHLMKRLQVCELNMHAQSSHINPSLKFLARADHAPLVENISIESELNEFWVFFLTAKVMHIHKLNNRSVEPPLRSERFV